MNTTFKFLSRDPKVNCVSSSKETRWGGLLTERWAACAQHISNVSFEKPCLWLNTDGERNSQWRTSGLGYAYKFRPGTFFLVNAGFQLRDMDIDAPGESIGVELDFLKLAHWKNHDVRLIDNLPSHAMGEDKHIASLILAMKDEIACGCPSGRLFDESISLALMTYIEGHFSVNRYARDDFPQGLSRVKLRRLKDFIMSNLNRDLSLDDLARVAELSPQYLCRTFKKAVGTTPYQYIVEARIEKAKEILLHGEQSIAETALEVGFSSQSHFSDSFRRVTGMSPRQFRRS